MGIRAIRFNETGPAEILRWEEIDVPPPGPGEVRLKNKAIGINMKEIGERQGAYPGPPLPAIPGIEAAAQVVTVGDGVTEFRSGDRVAYATMPTGSYCEDRVLPAERLVHLPDEIDDETAAACMHKGMTVRYLVKKTFPGRRGDTILVHAAAGGVGL